MTGNSARSSSTFLRENAERRALRPSRRPLRLPARADDHCLNCGRNVAVVCVRVVNYVDRQATLIQHDDAGVGPFDGLGYVFHYLSKLSNATLHGCVISRLENHAGRAPSTVRRTASYCTRRAAKNLRAPAGASAHSRQNDSDNDQQRDLSPRAPQLHRVKTAE